MIARMRSAATGSIPSRLRKRWRRKVSRRGLGRRRIPVSRSFGFDRGQPIDRYYIEDFLARHGSVAGYAPGAIKGRVLEIGGREYVDRYGLGDDLVVDVLHANASNPEATLVGDLSDPGALPPETFDCIVCTQVLCVVWDVPAALATMHRALKPGGVLLATVPGITQGLTPDRYHWGDWWRFTAGSARRLAEDAFEGGDVRVETYGNLLAATLFLHGHAAEEATREELDLRDPLYEVTIAVHATKGAGVAPGL